MRYRSDIDVMKGLAILAVVLYHSGLTQCGYLGVDVFFVVSGFLFPSPSSFRPLPFLEKRLFRLLPMLLLVSAVILCIGYWSMLPHDYRYLSESVLATSLFGNNVLQAITTQNYWAAIYHNVLMHTWYIGVIMQFYVVMTFIVGMTKRHTLSIVLLLSIISLTLYLGPWMSISQKFYLLPARFFELGIGVMAGIFCTQRDKLVKLMPFVEGIVLTLLTILIFASSYFLFTQDTPYNLVSGTNYLYNSLVPKEILLLLTIALTTLLIVSENIIIERLSRLRILNQLGRMSYSIFLWHQPLLAFYRYFFTDVFGVEFWIGFTLLLLTLSSLSYYFLERRMRINHFTRISLLTVFLVINGFALKVYTAGGVTRPMPELGIYDCSFNPSTFEAYTDRIYQYNNDFTHNEQRKKLLIIGNSQARDFANILLESTLRDSIAISYQYGFEHLPTARIATCDYLIYFGWKHNVPDSVWHYLRPDADAWGIGPKNFGSSMGRIYRKRQRSDYHQQTATITPDFWIANRKMHAEWGDHFIDLLTPLKETDGSITAFTPEGRLISFDGYHLTQEGAKYLATKLIDKK